MADVIGGRRVRRADPGVATQARMRSLVRFNLWMAALHAVQGGVMLAISSDFSLPVTTSFLTLDPGEQVLVPDPETAFTVRIGPLVAAFLFLSALAHLVVGTAWRRRYAENLARGMNPARWVEYSASASLMIVVIAMLAGIYDIASLLLLFGLNVTMIWFGWMMEKQNQTTERVDWTSFWFGSVAGALPWIAIGIYLFGAGAGEGQGPPTFVYFIFLSMFLFFNVFAVNMALQYRRIGRWRDYLNGERVYILLSLVAKSLLAWQVFAGTLRPV